MSKVTLDRETFKALASETRLDLLRALDERQKTGTELARELGLNKATVHEHMQLLATSGLVQKKDEGRKWQYWELSWQGTKLLHPGQGAVFSVLLGLSSLATIIGIVMLGVAAGWWMSGAGDDTFAPVAEGSPFDEGADGETQHDESQPEADQTAEETDPKEGQSTSPDDGGDTDTAAAAPPPDEPEEADSADGDFATDFGKDQGLKRSGGGLGEGGVLAVALLLTAIISASLAMFMRRRR